MNPLVALQPGDASQNADVLDRARPRRRRLRQLLREATADHGFETVLGASRGQDPVDDSRSGDANFRAHWPCAFFSEKAGGMTISFLVSAVAASIFIPARLQSQNRDAPQISSNTRKPIDWEEDT